MAQRNTTHAYAALGTRGLQRRVGDYRSTIGHSDGLVETENGQIAVGADWGTVTRTQPRLRGIFDQQQVVLIAPCTPAGGILGQSQIVRQVESSNAVVEERLEILLTWLQQPPLPSIVEATANPSLDERLNLRAMMVRRHENLVSRIEPQCLDAHKQSLSR